MVSTVWCQDTSLASMGGPPNGQGISPTRTPDPKLTCHVLSLGSQPPRVWGSGWSQLSAPECTLLLLNPASSIVSTSEATHLPWTLLPGNQLVPSVVWDSSQMSISHRTSLQSLYSASAYPRAQAGWFWAPSSRTEIRGDHTLFTHSLGFQDFSPAIPLPVRMGLPSLP